MSPVTGRRIAPWWLLATALASLASCNGGGGDPTRTIVAEVGGKPVTAAQLQAYLDANLVVDPGADPLPPRDLARVKSRLFDDYLDGEVLLREAEHRKVTITDAELSDYLGPNPPAAPAARDVARRDLTIQKLRESVVLAEIKVTDAQVDAWLAAHPAPAESAVNGALRMLRFASYPEAMRVRQEIVSKKLSFDQAEASYGADALSDGSHEVDLSAFPEHIATAVKSLGTGQVSQPLPFESSTLLFLLDVPEAPNDAAARRREQARNAIALDESQEAADRLLADLRKSIPVVRHAEQLPFPYVAESAPPHAQ